MDPRVWTGSPVVLYVRELADPSDGKGNRFIELYSPNKRNCKIPCHGGREGNDDDNPTAAPSFQPSTYQLVIGEKRGKKKKTSISLAGKRIDENGYLVFCKEGAWDGRCGEALSTGTKEIKLKPTDSVAIVIGNYPSNYDIVDIYGSFDKSYDDSQNFKDGRAVRKATATCPLPEFNQDDWVVQANMTTDEMNPGGSEWWDCHLIITELASPVNDTDARYVELFSDNCPGKPIGDNFKLVVIVAGSDIIPEEGIDLKDLKIGRDGFLVLCSTPEANVTYVGNCDYIVGKDTAVDNDGYNSIAIVLIGESDGPIIYDIYGEHLSRF